MQNILFYFANKYLWYFSMFWLNIIFNKIIAFPSRKDLAFFFLVHLLLMFLHAFILYGTRIISPDTYRYVGSPVQLSTASHFRWLRYADENCNSVQLIFSSAGTFLPRRRQEHYALERFHGHSLIQDALAHLDAHTPSSLITRRAAQLAILARFS